MPVSLGTVFGWTGCYWLVTGVLAPQVAQAYTARLEVSLSLQAEEGYESLLRRAEAVARAAAQRSFDRDVLVTEVEVTILGQNRGAIAPILLLGVSRQAWRNRPDPQIWATYFPTSESLLEINDDSDLANDQQPAAPAPASTPTPSQPGIPPQPTIPDTPDNADQPQSPPLPTEAQPDEMPQETEPAPPIPAIPTNPNEQPESSDTSDTVPEPGSNLPTPNAPIP
ncbi:MAG: hypothetical protein WA919_06155 [Coleofasciculaceae cyanobacterium]